MTIKGQIIKVLNLFRSPAPRSKKDNSNDILRYGTFNDFPLRVTEAVYSSPMATAAVETISKYIKGDGISDQNTAKIMVNEDQTLDDLLSGIADDFAILRGGCLKVAYNQLGKVINIRHIPFENTRLGIPDDEGYISKIHYNPFFGMPDFRKSGTTLFDTFNPKDAVSQWNETKDKYKGQFKWFALTKINNRFYPVPNYYSAINDIIADGKITTYRERLVDNNFYQSTLIKMYGDPDEQVQVGEVNGKPVYETRGDLLDEQLRKTTGVEMSGSALVLWGKTKEEMPEVVAFPNSFTDKISEVFVRQCQDNIARAFEVPPILLGIEVASSLGQNQLMLNAHNLMKSKVIDYQRIIERELKTVLKDWHQPIDLDTVAIKPLSMNIDLPESAWGVLTTQEKREFVNKNYDISLDLTPAEPNPDEQIDAAMNISVPMFIPMNVSVTDQTEAYNAYYGAVNMTYKELQTWSESDCCKALGYTKQNIQRNLHLLNLNKKDWTARDIRLSQQIVSAINKLKAMEPVSEVKDSAGNTCGFKRDLALKNLGHNIKK